MAFSDWSRQAEVPDLGNRFRPEENVSGLNVTVQDAVLVGVGSYGAAVAFASSRRRTLPVAGFLRDRLGPLARLEAWFCWVASVGVRALARGAVREPGLGGGGAGGTARRWSPGLCDLLG